jgi:outer membrane immunogenic protein
MYGSNFMKLKLALAASVFASALSSSAMAADMAMAAAPYDWNGVYVGALATYGFARSHHCDTAACPDNPITGSGPIVNGSGLGGGVTIGFNHTFNNFLLGAEGDYSFTGFNGSSPSQTTPGYGCGPGCITNVTALGTARIRVGLPMNNVLPYLTGGLAISNVHGELIRGSDTTFLNATAGGGVEVGVTQNVSVKAEYLHVFDNGQRFTFNPAACAAPGCSLNHYSDDLIRLGLNVRF